MAWHSEPDEDSAAPQLIPMPHAGMREMELDAAVTRRTTPKVRAFQVGVLLTLLLVVGGLVFRGYQAAQPRPQQTTTAVVDDFSMNVAIFSNVNYGTLSVNGKTLDAHPPVIVKLRPGLNSITVSAPPFRPHTCTYDMSRQSVIGAQCAGGGSVSPPMTIGGKLAPTSVNVLLTVADLPSAQRRDVEAIVTRAVDGFVLHTIVPAHQYIATGLDAHGHITSRVTGEELQADIAGVRVPTPTQYGSTCLEGICAPVTNTSDPSGLTGRFWTVAALVTPQWRFTTRTGETVATSPLGDSSFNETNEIEVLLSYDAVQGWQPKGAIRLGADSGALAIISTMECVAGMTVLSAYAAPGTSLGFFTHPNGIEGCELQVLTSSGKRAASFIWRFGVLLAADSGAQKMIPDLPVAPQAEIDAVTTS